MHAAAYVGDTESINALIQAGEEEGKGWKDKEREREREEETMYANFESKLCIF